MTVESNYMIAIATLIDWLKRLAPVFQPMRIKTKTIPPCTHDFSRASSELQVIARNCDWFIALPASVVIGRSNCFGFSTVICSNRARTNEKSTENKSNIKYKNKACKTAVYPC